jgi:hypothetical protein
MILLDNSEASIIEKEKTQWMNYYRRFIGLRSFRDKRRNAALVFRKSLQSRQSFDSGICHDGNLNSSSGACNIQ